MLFFPRDTDGAPVFPREEGEQPWQWHYELAVARGLPHEQAMTWAREQMGRVKRG